MLPVGACRAAVQAHQPSVVATDPQSTQNSQTDEDQNEFKCHEELEAMLVVRRLDLGGCTFLPVTGLGLAK